MQFRGTPYIQTDLRVSRSVPISRALDVTPFIEFFNLFNRNNPGANFVTNVAALPVPRTTAPNNVTDICAESFLHAIGAGDGWKPATIPAGGLGDFFGPGTTVGIPFAAQIGVRLPF